MTNNSARETLVTKLKKQMAYQTSDIISITGHSTDRGLDDYSSGDEDYQERLSRLNDVAPEATTASAPAPQLQRPCIQEI